jgi:hypothetical protein
MDPEDRHARNYIDVMAGKIRDGSAWTEGMVQSRAAYYLIDLGYIDHDGSVLRYPEG